MEGFGSFLDEEWGSLSEIFSPEESELLLHFINGEDFFPNQGEIPTNFSNDQSLFFPSDAFDQTNFYCISQESSNSSDIEGALFTNPVDENGVSFLHTNTYESVPVFPLEEMTLKRKYETPEIQTHDNDHSPDQSPMKKPQVSRDNGPKNKRHTQSKKKKKVVLQNDGEETNACSSGEDESNASESKNLASNGKIKASRGSATDPQSLYARRRRERINERLRILQNLVPNGTKVDISTMLEEAVHYVKFLQLQIKLLSSDELWMYAPIAYNGMDIGFLQKNIPNI